MKKALIDLIHYTTEINLRFDIFYAKFTEIISCLNLLLVEYVAATYIGGGTPVKIGFSTKDKHMKTYQGI